MFNKYYLPNDINTLEDAFTYIYANHIEDENIQEIDFIDGQIVIYENVEGKELSDVWRSSKFDTSGTYGLGTKNLLLFDLD